MERVQSSSGDPSGRDGQQVIDDRWTKFQKPISESVNGMEFSTIFARDCPFHRPHRARPYQQSWDPALPSLPLIWATNSPMRSPSQAPQVTRPALEVFALPTRDPSKYSNGCNFKGSPVFNSSCPPSSIAQPPLSLPSPLL